MFPYYTGRWVKSFPSVILFWTSWFILSCLTGFYMLYQIDFNSEDHSLLLAIMIIIFVLGFLALPIIGISIYVRIRYGWNSDYEQLK